MQRKIPMVFMRGGTSRALFFREEDLPSDLEVQDRVILAAMGSPDPYRRQIDGLGAVISSTSKVAIIGRGTRPGVDVTYYFGQVGVDRAIVDRRGTCGNISAAVGPYAVEEGMVRATDPMTDVTFLNINTNKVVVVHVPTRDGQFECDGDFAIPGIPGTGSKIVLDYMDPGGAVTGKLLPTGRPRDVLDVPGVGRFEVSLVDAANPFVFLRFEDFGLTGEELPQEIDDQKELMRRVERVRAEAGVAIGMASTAEEIMRDSPLYPAPVFVTAPRPYRMLDGRVADPADVDVVVKAISMGNVHRAYPMTGAVCTTVAAMLPETLVRDALSSRARESGQVRLGHPSGDFEMTATLHREGGEWRAEKVSYSRTARRLLEGHVLVPERLFGPQHD